MANYSEELQKKIDGALTKAAIYVEKELKKAVPVKTGHLKRSITHEVHGDYAEIGTNVEYAKYVEYGTPPHDIVPKDKKALAFKKGGKKIVVKKVRHPGTRPQMPFRKTLMKVAKPVSKIFEKELKK